MEKITATVRQLTLDVNQQKQSLDAVKHKVLKLQDKKKKKVSEGSGGRLPALLQKVVPENTWRERGERRKHLEQGG